MPSGEPADEPFGASNLVGILHHHGDDGVKITITHVTEKGGDQPAFLDVLLGLDDTFGETGYGHAHVCDDHL